MKRVALIIIFGIVGIISICTAVHAFNFKIFDTVYNFDYAKINMCDGTYLEGKIDNWRDYDDSDVVQVCINGTTYLTHYSNVVLISNP